MWKIGNHDTGIVMDDAGNVIGIAEDARQADRFVAAHNATPPSSVAEQVVEKENDARHREIYSRWKGQGVAHFVLMWTRHRLNRHSFSNDWSDGQRRDAQEMITEWARLAEQGQAVPASPKTHVCGNCGRKEVTYSVPDSVAEAALREVISILGNYMPRKGSLVDKAIAVAETALLVKQVPASPTDEAPNTIYLQYHGDGEPDDESPVRDADVTWCRDKIFEHDLEYVRVSTPSNNSGDEKSLEE